MKILTRRAAAVASIAILVGAAGSGTLAAQGQGQQQQVTAEVVIPISAVSRDHQDHGEHRRSTHHIHRADWSEQSGSSHSRTGKSRTGQHRSAEVGVEAAAETKVWGQASRQPSVSAGVEVVLKSLPGVDATGGDSAEESCS